MVSVKPGNQTPCVIPGRLAGLRYEMTLLEEARSHLGKNFGELLERCTVILKKLGDLRDKRDPGECPTKESLDLLQEIKELTERMKENSTEGQWVASELAGRRYAVAAEQMVHIEVEV